MSPTTIAMEKHAPTIAYFSNLFPSPVEPYVVDEIQELRRRGLAVVPCSARRPRTIDPPSKTWLAETLYLQPLSSYLVIRAAWVCFRKLSVVSRIVLDAFLEPHQALSRKAKAVIHTFLGACLVAKLGRTKIDHIHVHHGYFGCWIAMAAARLLEIPYSVTLHGSDLLLRKSFLETKLRNSRFCITVSEFNRRHILEHYPTVDPRKIFVRRMGVKSPLLPSQNQANTPPVILAVGRLQSVKNHAFLINACAELKLRRRLFACLIAGEGPERRSLELLIHKRQLEHQVVLLGHLSPSKLDAFYSVSNLVVLTSRSEGLPVAMMEAMARGKIVLAPAITGIPELVVDGETGFLFREGCLDSFIETVQRIYSSTPEALDRIRACARQVVSTQFDREANLTAFADLLLKQIEPLEISPHENFVLQQI